MKVRFKVFKMDGMYEMNAENIKKAEKICLDNSRDYAFYVLCIGANKKNEIEVYMEGPLEC